MLEESEEESPPRQPMKGSDEPAGARLHEAGAELDIGVWQDPEPPEAIIHLLSRGG